MRIVAVLGSALFVLTACRDGSGPAQEDEVRQPDCIMIGVTVLPSYVILHPGDTLRAMAKPNPCASPTTFRWISPDTTIAVVDSLTGLIRARALGRTSITAIDRNDPAQRAAMAIDVTP